MPMSEKNADEQWLMDINQQLEEAYQGMQLIEYGRLIDRMRQKAAAATGQLEIARVALEVIRDLAWTFRPPPGMDEAAWQVDKSIEIGRIASTALHKISDVGKG
jgi:hypothetical protein